MMDIVVFLSIIVTSYLIGALPTAYFAGKLNGINIFEHGSGNMGATNVIRTLGFGWGIGVLLIDLFKGIAAVMLAQSMVTSDAATQALATTLAAIAVVLGHNWSVWVTLITGELRGGKGAATTAGVFIAALPPLAIIIPLLCVAVILYATRYMSLSVMSGAVIGTLVLLGYIANGTLEPIFVAWLFFPLMMIYRHRENIKRLMAGNERKLGDHA